MTDTRNNNTRGNYCLEQRKYSNQQGYNTYVHSQYGTASNPALPCFGVMPSHMPRTVLSQNPIDIESQLFGIGSCNLVTPKPPVNPEINTLQEISYFERLPLIQPKKYKQYKTPRPFPVPN